MWLPLRWLLVFLIALSATAVIAPTPSRADSWLPPETRTTASPDESYRFTVQPSPVDSALEYFAEELNAVESGTPVERPAPRGLLERRGPGGQWDRVWEGPLVNSIAPVTVLVCDCGYVATFDNWHSIGHGDHVVVIYGPAGRLVRTMPLGALLPQHYIDALPHSVSSLSWRKAAKFDESGARLLLDVKVPSQDHDAEEAVRFAIALADGAIIAPADEQWEQALAAADAINARRVQAEAERRAFLIEPLVAPDGCDAGDWQAYLLEAFFRLTPKWLDRPYPARTVLFPPDHERFETSVEWLVEAVADEAYFPGDVAVASPCSDAALVDAIRTAFVPIETGALRDATFYIVASVETQDALARLIEPSGAEIVWLYRNQAIPQRPERIPGSLEEAAANEESLRRERENMAEIFQELGELR